MKQQTQEKKAVHICPKCNGTNVVSNKGGTNIWCRRCGFEWERKS